MDIFLPKRPFHSMDLFVREYLGIGEDGKRTSHSDLDDLFLDVLQPEVRENAEDFVVEHAQDIGDDGEQESIATAVRADDSEDDEVVNHADLGDLFLDILQPEDHENAEDFVVERPQDIGDDGEQESIATAVSADDSEDDEVVNHADLDDLFLDVLQPEDHENAEDFVVEHDQDIGDDGQQESIATAVSADDSEDSEVMSYSPVAHRTRSRSRVRAVQMGAQGDQNAAPVILNVDNDEGALEVPAAKDPTRQRQARAPRPKSKAVAHTNDAAQPSTSGVQVQRGRSRTNQNKKRNAAQHDVRAKSKGNEQAVVTLGAPRTPVWRKETNAPTENAGPTATKQATTSAAHQSSGKSKEVVTRRKKIASHAVVAVSNAVSAQAAHKPKETAEAAPKNAGVGPRTPRSAVQTRAKQQKIAAGSKETNKVDSHQPGTSKMKPQKNAGAPNAAAAPSQPEGILTRAQKAKLEKAQAAQN